MKIGQQLRVDWLVNRTELNGQLVVIQTLPDDAGRATGLLNGALLRLHVDRLVHPVQPVLAHVDIPIDGAVNTGGGGIAQHAQRDGGASGVIGVTTTSCGCSAGGVIAGNASCTL